MIHVPRVFASSLNIQRFPHVDNKHNSFKLKKYVNSNEVKRGIELLVQLRQIADISSILVITPVRYNVL